MSLEEESSSSSFSASSSDCFSFVIEDSYDEIILSRVEELLYGETDASEMVFPL